MPLPQAIFVPLALGSGESWAVLGLAIVAGVVVRLLAGWHAARRGVMGELQRITAAAPPSPCYRVVGRVRSDGRATTFYVAAASAVDARAKADARGVAAESIEEEW